MAAINVNIAYYNTNEENKKVVLSAAEANSISVCFVNNIKLIYNKVTQSYCSDMIFLDYNGEEELLKTISYVHNYDPDLVIYVLSTISSDDEKIKVYESGATEYIVMPLNSRVFKYRLRNMAVLRDSRRMLYQVKDILQDEVKESIATIKERELDSLLLLGKASEYRDTDTGDHILRVGKYSAMIMEKLGGSKESQELMLYSAPLHDVGKIGIPDSILNKNGRLTDEEYNIMKTHPVKGYELLSGTKSKYLDAGAIIALSHHEKYDGTGYPKGLKGNEIPLYGRIVALADVFDALTSERVYKNSWTLEQAIDYIREQSGTHFDPKIVDVFLANIDEAVSIMKNLPPKVI